MIRNVSVRPAAITGAEEVVVFPFVEGKRALAGLAAQLNRRSRGVIQSAIAEKRFRAGAGETLLLTARALKCPNHILLLGLGPADQVDAESAAHAGGAASRELARLRFRSAWLVLDKGTVAYEDTFLRAFIKGFALGNYRFSLAEKPGPKATLRRLTILADSDRPAISAAAEYAMRVAEHAAALRDWVNTPAATMTPSALARSAQAMCRENKVHCRVLTKSDLEREKMGAVLAVARGSKEDPRMVVMHHNRDRKDLPLVCLVGKGVTFDTGGISLKPWDRMHEMKSDMAGAALVINVVNAAAKQDLPLSIVGVVPCVENMPDGDAFRPGDVITTHSGKTIEVLSTDAEGRLILADAISWSVKHYRPSVLVDFATLTGAVLIALGTRIAGVMGNSQKHIDALVRAGIAAGEPVWQLPLDRSFYDAVKGDISDFKNYAGRNGSTITAAALLGKFVGNTPWAHIDIAGTSWAESGAPAWQTKGATGYGVDLTLRFLEDLARG